MYQVIVMYGDNEPWWFFDDWEEDIIDTYTYESFAEAKQKYQELSTELKAQYDEMKERANYLAAFWNKNDVAFCEDCDEDLQQYKGLLLLKDHQVLSNENK